MQQNQNRVTLVISGQVRSVIRGFEHTELGSKVENGGEPVH